MIKKILLTFAVMLLSVHASEDTNQSFTENKYYMGVGWKTFQMGRLQANNELVNGGAVRFNVGMYIPTQNIKIELTTTYDGGLGYKTYTNGIETENDITIGLKDHGISFIYGTGKQEHVFDAFPFLLLGVGAKVITTQTEQQTMPAAQVGVGFNIQNGHIDFFAKFTADILAGRPSFTLSNGDTVNVQSYNGALEAGFNYVF